ncbi:MAG: hypothetical protein J6S21_04370, partial [Victivallales bacterium]|nr:hypothetical protein [Victivallales bacterium]
MKKFFAMLLLLALSGAVWAADVAESRKLLIPERKVTFYQVSKAPVLDGDLSDVCWQGIPVWTDFRIPQVSARARGGDRTPPMNTEVRLGFDRYKMYFAFKCYDPAAKELPPGQKPGKEWNGDHVTMFFSPKRPDSDTQQATYYAHGGKHLSYRGKAPAIPFKSTWGLMRSAVRFHDGYWEIEAEVPFNNLEFNPFEDKGMRGQICRALDKLA